MTNLYSRLDDHQLADLLKSGDQVAFTEIYNRYKYLLYLHAYKRIRNADEAEDLVHDLFAVLWNNRENFVLKTHLSGYLYTSVRNRIFKLLSHKDIESVYLSSFFEAGERAVNVTDHLVRENQLLTQIEKEIASLPVKMRQIFEMSRKQHLSHKEIADQLHLSEQTVSKQVTNALKILRTKLGLLTFLIFLIRY
ncbi:RNA polymerase subunit sigma-70 [Pedobacter sp. HMWF019]|uniref:RNA polymerase sigma-70 factor n=1 Tax=Pedobacter sp. HMWF019 TaxID=2056856 RepID=UPI000D37A106|nr:RNA polymerase sigma-70 factor [Pedobacter sp. HMWF019]PTT03873.1 RNA polymerase subunit sigma-70 [Pedobacter sp. HMWF019]